MGDPIAWCVCSLRDAPLSFSFFSLILVIILIFVFFLLTVKERPDLESKFDERVQTAVKYARRIEDFNELIDPRTFLVTV